MNFAYEIYPEKVRTQFETLGVSIRELGNPKSECYIGCTDRTIGRMLHNGYASANTLACLHKIKGFDVSAIIKNPYNIYTENQRLRRHIKELERRVAALEQS